MAVDTAELSLAQQVAQLTEEQREAVLADLDPEKLAWDAGFWLRPAQIPPEGDWNVHMVLSGRGWGKSRSGAEWVRKKAISEPGCRILLVGRTSADVNNVMIFGDSGIMSVCPDDERPEHQPSKRKLVWANGSTAEAFSSESPSTLRGPQGHYAWLDELGSWSAIPDDSGLTAYDNARIATRLGENPQLYITTTPKRTPAIQKLLEEHAESPDRVNVIRGTTFENAGNLSQSYFDAITGVYAGSSVEKQELLGMMLEDSEGALWTPDMIDKNRALTSEPPATGLRVVGVDPSVAERPTDECGIVVCGSTRERELWKRHAYVLEDASILGPPSVWTQRVVEMSKKWNAPVIVEKNNGGQLVVDALTSKDATIKVFPVSAAVGKKLRAEPVVLPYEQGRVHHWGVHADLESQMESWDPEISKKSPDRIDALVWALTGLLVKPPQGFGGNKIRAKSVAGARLPSARLTGRRR